MRVDVAWLYVLLFVLAGGCSGDDMLPGMAEGADGGRTGKLVVRVAPQEYIDSAQVFFFRPAGGGDTLIAREVVYGIEAFVPRAFTFDLPAGKYDVWIFGNVPTGCVVASPPYSSEDIYFDYGGCGEPGVVAYSSRAIAVGADTATTVGMLLLSGYVELTIRDVPAGVDRMVVTLGNTSSGLTLKAGYLPRAMDPPLTDTLYDVRAGGTYQSDFYCFPSGEPGGVSMLGVKCFGAEGQLLYSGQAPALGIRPGYDYRISCTFGSRARGGDAAFGGGTVCFREDGE